MRDGGYELVTNSWGRVIDLWPKGGEGYGPLINAVPRQDQVLEQELKRRQAEVDEYNASRKNAKGGNASVARVVSVTVRARLGPAVL